MEDEVLKRASKLLPSVQESSLSRLWKHTEKYDIAIISAFRSKLEQCIRYNSEEDKGRKLHRKENKKRNRELLSALLMTG